MRVSRWLVAVFLVLMLAVSAPAAEPVVKAGLSSDQTFLGDEVILTIVVEESNRAEAPPLAAFGDAFDVDYLGGQDASEHSTVIVNGRVSETRSVRYVMRYRLRPQKSGQLTVPELTVSVNGQDLVTPRMTLDVVAPRPSPVAELALHVTPERPYVEQDVTFELEVRIRAFSWSDRWVSERDAWTRAIPGLTVPWFKEYGGFETDEFAPWAERMLSGSEGGFAVNNLRDTSFFPAGLLTFYLPVETVDRDGVPWRVYRLRKTLRPVTSGTFDVPLASLRGTFITAAEGRSRPESVAAEERAFVTHDPVRVIVRPVPSEGRPATYSHAVGRLRASAEIAPQRAKVGDPVTLSLRVWGEGRTDAVQAPALGKQENLVRDFVVEVGTEPSLVDGDTKVFTYTIRPRHATVDTVPPLEVAFFDPVSETFDVTRTPSLSIEVERAVSVGASDVVDEGGGGRRVTSPGEEQSGGLLANRPVDELLADHDSGQRGATLDWVVLIGAPFGFGVLALLSERARRRRADPLGQRAARAASDARVQLAAAADASDAVTCAGHLHQALAGFVAARARRPAGGMTADDVAALLRERGVNAPEAASLVEALRLCETVRYGGADAAALRSACGAAPEWIAALETERLA